MSAPSINKINILTAIYAPTAIPDAVKKPTDKSVTSAESIQQTTSIKDVDVPPEIAAMRGSLRITYVVLNPQEISNQFAESEYLS
jgi:hypothetical protein